LAAPTSSSSKNNKEVFVKPPKKQPILEPSDVSDEDGSSGGGSSSTDEDDRVGSKAPPSMTRGVETEQSLVEPPKRSKSASTPSKDVSRSSAGEDDLDGTKVSPSIPMTPFSPPNKKQAHGSKSTSKPKHTPDVSFSTEDDGRGGSKASPSRTRGVDKEKSLVEPPKKSKSVSTPSKDATRSSAVEDDLGGTKVSPSIPMVPFSPPNKKQTHGSKSTSKSKRTPTPKEDSSSTEDDDSDGSKSTPSVTPSAPSRKSTIPVVKTKPKPKPAATNKRKPSDLFGKHAFPKDKAKDNLDVELDGDDELWKSLQPEPTRRKSDRRK
jgi:hypothetical protein